MPERTSWKSLSDEKRKALFEDFCSSSLELGQWCVKRKISPGSFSQVMRESFPEEWLTALKSKKKKSSGYVLGRSLEYKVRDLFQAAGYFVVRAAQSKGLVDLVALSKARTVLIQCKRSGKISGEEWDQLFNLASEMEMIPVLAERPTGNGVDLWRITSPAASRARELFSA